MTQECNQETPGARGDDRGLAALLPVEVFQALSDPNRVALLTSLAASQGPQRVSDVGRQVPVDLSVASRHLKVLARAGILDAERRGREVLYRVRARPLIDRLRALADALERCCGDEARGFTVRRDDPDEEGSP